MPERDDSRYAVYFAPAADSALWRAGSRWLGWDAVSGDRPRQPVPAGIQPDDLTAFTSAPRFYGFHATLKPPFHLAQDRQEKDLVDAVAAFAAGQPAFEAPPPKLGRLGRFLALVLSAPSPAMDGLAAASVCDLDTWRRPLSARDQERRRANGLTDRQEHYLTAWGYPYVLEEFRFHMSLTGGIEDDGLRERFRAALAPQFTPFEAEPLRVDAVCLFRQPDRETPFRQVERFPLATKSKDAGRAT